MVVRIKKGNFKNKLTTKTTHLIRGQVELPDGRTVKRNKCGNILPLGEFRARRQIRNHATSVLSRAYLEDILTAEEYHTRFKAVTKAKTETELKRILCDLPARVFPPIHTSEKFFTEKENTLHIPAHLWELPPAKGNKLVHKIREEAHAVLQRAFEEEMLTLNEFNERLLLSQSMRTPENFTTLLADIPDYINTFNPHKYITPQPTHRKHHSRVVKNFTTLLLSSTAIVAALTVDLEPAVEKLAHIVPHPHN